MDQFEKEIGGQTYRIGRLNAYNQLHVARKLAPALWAFGSAGVATAKGGDAESAGLSIEDLALLSLKPVADAIAKLSNEDAEFVLDTCLHVVQRKVAEGTYQPVKLPGNKKLMFEDLRADSLMEIVITVIKENLGNFFPSPPASQ